MTSQEWKNLCDNTPVLLDGAWGSQLQQAGLPPGESPESWNLSHPDKVQAIGEAYVRAGSRIILTNTFGGNRFVLERHGLADRIREVNLAGAELSRRAAGVKALVFGSIGPSGKMIMMGDVTADELAEAFSDQALALHDGGVNGLVVETMSDLEEAVIATKAAVGTGLPVVSCMVYGSGPGHGHTMMGITPGQAAEALEQAGAWAVGANCGCGPDDFLPICRQYREATGLPIWMKPNAGLPDVEDGKTVYRMAPDEFARSARRLWQDGGATFIGGCCGTNPAFIETLRLKNDSLFQ